MSKIYSTRDKRIKEQLDRVFGNSPQAEELKAIAFKAQTEGITDEEAKQFWDDKQREIDELKERMPVANDLALPVESVTYYGKIDSNLIVNGTVTVSGCGEDDRCQNPAIKHEVFFGDVAER
jgi:hypothetical protein